MIINEKQQSNDPIVGCEYVFPGDVDSETRIGSNKTAVTLVTGSTYQYYGWMSKYYEKYRLQREDDPFADQSDIAYFPDQ